MPDAAWTERLFATIDAMDADAFAAHLTEDGVFRWGSLDPVRGRPAVREFVAGFFSGFRSLSHRLHQTWEIAEDDVVFVQGEVTYVLPDRVEVTVPFLNLCRLRGDEVAEYLIYADPTPLNQVAGS